MLGRSTTMRAGEASVSTVGETAPLAVISTLTPPLVCDTPILCSAARPIISVPAVCAPAIVRM
ncbi:MAG TPA: hypothetical protein VJ728_04560, partial [Candidatus Binataceae bacterium]|nr:hypothetical protein [Candidatus Binataceae bacterium]